MRDEPLSRRGKGLAELARRQHGVVSIRQLTVELGFSRSAVSRAATSGSLHPLHRGVYAVGHTDLSTHGVCLAAVLAAGDGALLSHFSAAWLWGLSRTSPIPVHVTASIPRSARRGFRLHYARHLEAEDRKVIDCIPVTSLPRTLLDQAAAVTLDRLRRSLQRAEELGAFDLGPVESVLSRNAGHAGCGPLRRALALYRPPRFTRSGFERDFVAAIELAGLPDPVTGWVEGGYELDVYWPDHRFAVELDVFETHGTRESFESDRLRQEDLKLAGIELVRITGPRFYREPREVLERVRRLLAQRGFALDARRRRGGGR
jgi:hypothetical protein